MEDDLILGEDKNTDDPLDVIESQLTIINSVLDVPEDIYDAWTEDRVKVITAAMRIILKLQKNIIKEIP